MKARILVLVLLSIAGLASVQCSSSENDKDVVNLGPDGERLLPDGAEADGKQRNQSPAFTYNGEVCKVSKTARSAVTVQVEIGGIDTLDQYAALLKAEGFEVMRGPEQPVVNPEVGEDVVSIPDTNTRESFAEPDELADVAQPEVVPAEVVEPKDVPLEPVWTGGEYVIALTGLNDVIFLVEDGTLGVASWCPIKSLGQVRRLDYTLVDAVRIFGDLAMYDFIKETDGWARPVSYYSHEEGVYQRSYMSESLDIDEGHSGQLSISGNPTMAGFALYGHADSPSQVGDVVGVDLLQVGQTKVAENDTVTVSAQVVRLWDISSLIGEGENPVIVDPFVQDASINWQVGRYYFFADVVFPDNIHGSLVMNLQGAPPGKLLISKSVESLAVPPVKELVYGL